MKKTLLFSFILFCLSSIASAAVISSGAYNQQTGMVTLEVAAYCADSTFSLEAGICSFSVPASCGSKLVENISLGKQCNPSGIARTLNLPVTMKTDGSLFVISGDAGQFTIQFPGSPSEMTLTPF